MKAIVIGLDENGKKILKFDTTGYDHGYYHGRFISEENRLALPCGQCVQCRIQRSREWANRCMMELQYHDSAYFVTLTYRPGEEPVPIDEETGETPGHYTLHKKDLQDFWKRLRKAYPDDKIRYFACGEYGDNTMRPHYHAIIYGLHLDDLKVYKKSSLGFSYFNSEKLEKIWSHGYVVVSEVTWETCAYTARYCLKKRTGKESHYYSDLHIQPEFVVMSRKPGIAKQYFEDHDDIFDFSKITISTPKGGIQFNAPRYFEKLYELENPDHLQEIKSKRQKIAVEVEKSKLRETSLDRDEYLAVEARSFEEKIKSLRRSCI